MPAKPLLHLTLEQTQSYPYQVFAIAELVQVSQFTLDLSELILETVVGDEVEN